MPGTLHTACACQHRDCTATFGPDPIVLAAHRDRYLAGGVPQEWLDWVPGWVLRGIEPEQIAPYRPEATNRLTSPNDVPQFLACGITGPQVRAMQNAGLIHSDDVFAAWGHGVRPELLDAYLAPQITEDNVTWIGSQFTRLYGAWRDTGATPALIDAFLLDGRTGSEALRVVLQGWVEVDLDPARIVRLHHAGITAAELAAHPELADADPDHLDALAALRAHR